MPANCGPSLSSRVSGFPIIELLSLEFPKVSARYNENSRFPETRFGDRRTNALRGTVGSGIVGKNAVTQTKSRISESFGELVEARSRPKPASRAKRRMPLGTRSLHTLCNPFCQSPDIIALTFMRGDPQIEGMRAVNEAEWRNELS